MRKTDDIINLILDIYHGHEWEDMEEFFVAAQAILSYHWAKFKLLDDIVYKKREEITNYFVDIHGAVPPVGFMRTLWLEKYNGDLDSNEELSQLNKYEDSEEGFREELNAAAAYINGKKYHNDSIQIFHKFITFKD